MKSIRLIVAMFAATAMLVSFAASPASADGSDEELPDKVTGPLKCEPPTAAATSPAMLQPTPVLHRSTLSSMGRWSMMGAYKLGSTAGQMCSGASTMNEFEHYAGFWPIVGTGCCTLRGDTDHSGNLNIADLTFLVNYLFKGGPASTCFDEGDVDANGNINIGDLTYLVAYLFQGGPEPPACP